MYKDRIKFETELDLALLNKTNKGKKTVRTMRDKLQDDDIWLIKSWGVEFSLRELVDLLFRYDIDVFDIEYGSITKIYACKMDAYRIQNSVVYSLENEKNKK